MAYRFGNSYLGICNLLLMGITGLKKKLDTVFSLFIRLRDANKKGMVTCCTCGAIKFWKEVDAGHYITRGDMATRFDPRNVAGQCKRCNMRGGEQHKMGMFIDKKYGEGTTELLQVERHKIFKLSRPLLEDMIKKYQEKVKQLQKEKGL